MGAQTESNNQSVVVERNEHFGPFFISSSCFSSNFEIHLKESRLFLDIEANGYT